MKTILAAIVSLVLCGCVSSSGSRIPGNNRAPTDAASVQVLYQEPKRPFVIVGHVSVDRAIANQEGSIERKFRSVAATMGAQAVIIDRIPKASFANVTQGEGRAIVWEKP